MDAPSNGDDFMTLSVGDDEADEFDDAPAHHQHEAESGRHAKPGKSRHKKHSKDKSHRKKEREIIIPLPPPEDGGMTGEEEELSDDKDEQEPVQESQEERQIMYSKECLLDLYRSLNMDQAAAKHTSHQLNILHIRGTDNLTERDVLSLFRDLAPLRAVWISDTSCNVVFVDEVSAALALKSVSQPFRISIHRPDSMGDRDASPHSRRKTTRSAVEFDVDTGEEVSVSTLGAFPLPVPRGVWRVARTPPAKAKQLLFRFARNSDKMPEIVTDRSQYFYGLAGKPRSAGHSRAQNGSISRSVVVEEVTPKISSTSAQLKPKTDTDHRNGSVNHSARRAVKGDLDAHHHRKTPYDRSEVTIPRKQPAETAAKPVRPGDLRYSLLYREQALPISSTDLRHRISNGSAPEIVQAQPGNVHSRLERPVGNIHSRLGGGEGEGASDLRNRLNLVRRMGLPPW